MSDLSQGNIGPAARPDGQSNTPAAPWPDHARLSALRAYARGMGSRMAVERYLPDALAPGFSRRGLIGQIRKDMAAFARSRGRNDLALLFDGPVPRTVKVGRQVASAIELLRTAPQRIASVDDPVGLWLGQRAARALDCAGIKTIGALILLNENDANWWKSTKGIGPGAFMRVQSLLAQNPELHAFTRRFLALQSPPAKKIPTTGVCGLIDAPMDSMSYLPAALGHLDGRDGQFRTPAGSSALRAKNDVEAIRAWLGLHSDSPATLRSYRKEAERLLLWSVQQRGLPLSSLTTEDAVAYRNFLRHPRPATKWIGPAVPRSSPDWKPFTVDLSTKSIAYSILVLGSLFRWLNAQRYVTVNPFDGIKVQGAGRRSIAAENSFSQAEWRLIRTIADTLEFRGLSLPAAQRIRFILDFGYATGLRADEFVSAKMGNIEVDANIQDSRYNQYWLHVMGKGHKEGRVVLPALARRALEQYLTQRGLPVTPSHWHAQTPILTDLSSMEGCLQPTAGQAKEGVIPGGKPFSSKRLRTILSRFFEIALAQLQESAPAQPALAQKLREATPHWLRHTHATHALQRGPR